MIQSLKKCWYWFINLLFNDKFKKSDKENISINNSDNNLEEKDLKVISCKVRYIKEKEN